jgi:wyosine [tRNA(Phe)-imidazoG37] synthetase (radical SAM superfamily)
MRIHRSAFHHPDSIYQAVCSTVHSARERNEKIDYLSFVPDGEPTLDINLGRSIDRLRPLGIRIAVITNASLITSAEVREELSKADWVSVKIDAVDENTWRTIDRPHARLKLDRILEGIRTFARDFTGELVTETMIVAGINDTEDEAHGISQFIKSIRHMCAYLLVPTRPPAESNVKRPDEETLMKMYTIFRKKLPMVEMVTGNEGDRFAFAGDVEKEILSITSVHPMREDAVRVFLNKSGASDSVIQKLVDKGLLVKIAYCDHNYYIRNLNKNKPNENAD